MRSDLIFNFYRETHAKPMGHIRKCLRLNHNDEALMCFVEAKQ
jgi:hypothetical protein